MPLLLISLVNLGVVNGQTEKPHRFYFGLHFNATQTTSARIKSIEGAGLEPKSIYKPGHEYGLSFNYRIAEINIISFIYSSGVYNHAYKYEISSEENPFNGQPISEKSKSSFPNYSKIGLRYEYAAIERGNHSLNITTGVSMYRIGNGHELYTHTQYTTPQDTVGETVFQMYLLKRDQKPIYSISLGTAYYTSLFRKRDIRIGLEYNYSFRNWENGYYAFWPFYDAYSFGSYAVRGHLFNLGISYFFTGRKKNS